MEEYTVVYRVYGIKKIEAKDSEHAKDILNSMSLEDLKKDVILTDTDIEIYDCYESRYDD